jgi:hypothetical protein
VIVVAAGNLAKDEGKDISRYPARFGSPLASNNPYGQFKNLITVGAINDQGYEWPKGQTASYLTTFSSGQSLYTPQDPDGFLNDYLADSSGTSLGELRLGNIQRIMLTPCVPSSCTGRRWHSRLPPIS